MSDFNKIEKLTAERDQAREHRTIWRRRAFNLADALRTVLATKVCDDDATERFQAACERARELLAFEDEDSKADEKRVAAIKDGQHQKAASK